MNTHPDCAHVLVLFGDTKHLRHPQRAEASTGDGGHTISMDASARLGYRGGGNGVHFSSSPDSAATATSQRCNVQVAQRRTANVDDILIARARSLATEAVGMVGPAVPRRSG